MGVSLFIGKLTLAALFVTGILSTYKLANDNGFLSMMAAQAQVQPPTVPGSNIALRTHWTGVTAIDNLAVTFLLFFSPLFDAQNLGMLLQGLHFYGALISAWMLMQVEGYRVGNTWRVVSWVTVFGIAGENVAMAIAVPLWCLLHLSTSPTVGLAKSPATKRTGLLVHPIELRVIPWSVAIGLGVPTVMAAVCQLQETQPIYLSKQFWIVLRQLHPLLTAIVHLVLSVLTRASSVQYASAEQRDRDVVRNMQGVYTAATYASVIPHVATLTLVGAGVFIPGLLSEEYQAILHPSQVFQLAPFWLSPVAHIGAFAQGAAQFLRWDEVVTSASILTWALAVNRDSLPTRKMGSSFVLTLLKTAITAVLGGPGAAAVALVQERDSAVLEPISESEREKKAA